MNFFEHCSVDGKGTPVPIRGSFSYAVTDGEIARARSDRVSGMVLLPFREAARYRPPVCISFYSPQALYFLQGWVNCLLRMNFVELYPAFSDEMKA